jgi:hypothetical protein
MLALRGLNYETAKLDERRSIKNGFEGSKRFGFEAAQRSEEREWLFSLPTNKKGERSSRFFEVTSRTCRFNPAQLQNTTPI